MTIEATILGPDPDRPIVGKVSLRPPMPVLAQISEKLIHINIDEHGNVRSAANEAPVLALTPQVFAQSAPRPRQAIPQPQGKTQTLQTQPPSQSVSPASDKLLIELSNINIRNTDHTHSPAELYFKILVDGKPIETPKGLPSRNIRNSLLLLRDNEVDNRSKFRLELPGTMKNSDIEIQMWDRDQFSFFRSDDLVARFKIKVDTDKPKTITLDSLKGGMSASIAP